MLGEHAARFALPSHAARVLVEGGPNAMTIDTRPFSLAILALAIALSVAVATHKYRALETRYAQLSDYVLDAQDRGILP